MLVLKRFISDEIKRRELEYKNNTARAIQDYKCINQHLNASWAINDLYIPGNSQEQFGNVLEENLSLVYETAKLQEYEMWEM